MKTLLVLIWMAAWLAMGALVKSKCSSPATALMVIAVLSAGGLAGILTVGAWLDDLTGGVLYYHARRVTVCGWRAFWAWILRRRPPIRQSDGPYRAVADLNEGEHRIELGNLLFGCSRGEYPVPRKEFEIVFARLLMALPDSGGPAAFENETFVIRPYYWGECDCGHDDRAAAWQRDHVHGSECYQVQLKKRLAKATEDMPEAPPVGPDAALNIAARGAMVSFGGDGTDRRLERRRKLNEWARTEARRIARELCEALGIPWNDGAGHEAHCTCNYKDDWTKWSETNDHGDVCSLVLPNFHHKPSGYRLKWYKHPLRDSYASQNLSVDEFAVLIRSCVESVSGGGRAG